MENLWIEHRKLRFSTENDVAFITRGEEKQENNDRQLQKTHFGPVFTQTNGRNSTQNENGAHYIYIR